MDVKMSLYRIVDALQIPIDYVAGKVSGVGQVDYEGIPALCIQMALDVKKMFANETVGILTHVVGDLSIIVTHYHKTNVVTAMLVDGSKLEMDGVKTPPEMFFSKNSSGIEVVHALRHAIAASFLYQDRKWSVLKLP